MVVSSEGSISQVFLFIFILYLLCIPPLFRYVFGTALQLIIRLPHPLHTFFLCSVFKNRRVIVDWKTPTFSGPPQKKEIFMGCKKLSWNEMDQEIRKKKLRN